MKKLLSIVCGLLLWAAPAHAAIAFDAVSYATSATTTSLSWNHTVTGSNPILVAGVMVPGDSSGASGCTFNSVSMTQITTTDNPDGTHIYLFDLVNPATGTHAITCTIGVSAYDSMGGAISYTGAAQSGQPDSSHAATAAVAGSITVNTTVVASNSWLVMIAQSTAYDGNIVAGTGTTLRGTPSAGMAMLDSNNTVSTGSQGLQATEGAGIYWAGITASIAPVGAGGGGSTTHTLTTMGVGH